MQSRVEMTLYTEHFTLAKWLKPDLFIEPQFDWDDAADRDVHGSSRKQKLICFSHLKGEMCGHRSDDRGGGGGASISSISKD